MSILYVALAQTQTIKYTFYKKSQLRVYPQQDQSRVKSVLSYYPAATFSEAEWNVDWVSTVFQYMYWNGLQELKSS